jgi:hypothetical protein
MWYQQRGGVTSSGFQYERRFQKELSSSEIYLGKSGSDAPLTEMRP